MTVEGSLFPVKKSVQKRSDPDNSDSSKQESDQRFQKWLQIIYKTAIGQELRPYIEVLESDGMIYLDKNLRAYGEQASGSHYAIPEGILSWVREEDRIVLKDSDNLPDEFIAGVLVHEATHYRDAVNAVNKGLNSQSGKTLELNAHANQYRYYLESQLISLPVYTNQNASAKTALEAAYRHVYSNGSESDAVNALINSGYSREALSWERSFSPTANF